MSDLSSVGEVAKSIGDIIAGFVPEGPLRTGLRNRRRCGRRPLSTAACCLLAEAVESKGKREVLAPIFAFLAFAL
jgi:hypothetical protein